MHSFQEKENLYDNFKNKKIISLNKLFLAYSHIILINKENNMVKAMCERLAFPLSPLLSHVNRLLDRGQSTLAHEPSGAFFLRYSQTTPQEASLYQPLLCLVLQGAKEVSAGDKTLRVAQGQSLLVSHTLPVVSRVVEASPQYPYVALVLPLHFDLLRQMVPNLPSQAGQHTGELFSMSLSAADPELEDALLRFFIQSETLESRHLLAPITQREIHARLLLGPHTNVLQKLLLQEATVSRIHAATRAIQSDITQRLAVKNLAQKVGMSSTAFYQHFKAVTGTSPLQYQKDLRLLHAREALRSSNARVSHIAFDVGYESSAQFSREYARKFGVAPRQDRSRGPNPTSAPPLSD